MTGSDRRAWLLAHPVAAIAAFYLLVRLLGLAVGMRFDADNLTSWMQIADVDLLRHHLWRTLWYLHSQPPLFNLLIGLALRLGDTGFLWAMWLLFAGVTLGGILAVHALVRDLAGRPGWALAAAAWLCVSPAVLLFSQKLYYDGLVPWLVAMAVWGLHAGATRRSAGWMAFGFAMLVATVLLRSMIHPVVFAAVVAIYVAASAGQRVRVLAAAALPAALLAAVMLKNLAVFGTTALSSWPALNLVGQMVDQMPVAQRDAMIRRGELSHYAVLPGFAYPDQYLKLVPPTPPTGEPSLDDLRKSTGEANWNHRLFLQLAEPRMRDAMAGLAAAPGPFAAITVHAVYHFHRPPSEFKGLDVNRRRIAGWDRLANATVGLQPAAWAGAADDPARTQAPAMQLSLAALAQSLAFGGFVLLVAARLLAVLRARRWPSPTDATLTVTAMLGGFVILVSNLADVWENNRAHYDIGSVMLVGALVFAARLRDRRHPRSNYVPLPA